MKLLKRSFCVTLQTFIVASILLMVTGVATAADKTLLRISSPAVQGDWHAEMLYIFKERLEELAPGEFEVQVFLGGTLFKQGAEPTQMRRGNLDMALISMQDIAKRIRAYSIFTAGYLIRDLAHQKAVYYGPIGDEVFSKVSDVMDLEVLSVAYLGTRQLNLRSRRSVSLPSDLKGVKLRMPGSKAWQFLGKALGASPTPMAFNEVYLALKTGAIDGQDNPLPTNQKAKFHEVTEQIVLTGHLVDGVFFSMANKRWKSLSVDQQRKVKQAARAAAEFNDQGRVKDEKRLVEFFKSEGLSVTTPDVEAFRTHVQRRYLESDFSKNWPTGMLQRINDAAKK
ncbi:MAG: sialic acid TRAP transporter substrate-binding protein SiaP [Candidatus Polarisedimenticolaceae bacterium]|nr:sialic acid TRAP transporter substrate-binding protein SiaP [Candidatus Polarisedimenticolaceae bacterium]